MQEFSMISVLRVSSAVFAVFFASRNNVSEHFRQTHQRDSLINTFVAIVTFIIRERKKKNVYQRDAIRLP